MSEVVEHYLLRLTRSDVDGGDDGHKNEHTSWHASLRSIRDGSVVDFDEPSELLEFLHTKADA